MSIIAFLQSIPPTLVYATVGAIVAGESLGIPLPGEFTLIGAAILSSQESFNINPVWVAISAALGAAIGDSLGYLIGEKYGKQFLHFLGKHFPRHFSDRNIRIAEYLFSTWGIFAVFLGRFIALLRILSGPLAGSLRMKYSHFLAANLSGALCWAGATTTAVYYIGVNAGHWVNRFAWVVFIITLIIAGLLTKTIKERIREKIPE